MANNCIPGGYEKELNGSDDDIDDGYDANQRKAVSKKSISFTKDQTLINRTEFLIKREHLGIFYGRRQQNYNEYIKEGKQLIKINQNFHTNNKVVPFTITGANNAIRTKVINLIKIKIPVKVINKDNCSMCFNSGHELCICSNCKWCGLVGHKAGNPECKYTTVSDKALYPKPSDVSKPITQNSAQQRKRLAKLHIDLKPWSAHSDAYDYWLYVDPLINTKMSWSDWYYILGKFEPQVMSLDIEGAQGFDNQNYAIQVVAHCHFNGVGIQRVYNTYINQLDKIVKTNQGIHGISVNEIEKGCKLESVTKRITELLSDKALVGYGIRKDLESLGININNLKNRVIDISNYFENPFTRQKASLRKIVYYLCGRDIQGLQQHNCELDSRYTLNAYLKYKKKEENGDHMSYSELDEYCKHLPKVEQFVGWNKS